ncbi:MAG: thioredoxin family protein [Candidatus Neomarinimicrobiota bacterium]
MTSNLRTLIFSLVFLGFIRAGELDIGSTIPLPDYKMKDISGQEISLNNAAGSKGLLVIFSCNTCPWVTAWEDRYLSLTDTYMPKGIGMIAVNSNEAYRSSGDGLADMKARATDLGYSFYYALDENSRLATAFGATRTPHIFLFDEKGKLVYRGAIDDNARHAEKVKKAYLSNAIDDMLEGRPLTVTSTKALGCAIKFSEQL